MHHEMTHQAKKYQFNPFQTNRILHKAPNMTIAVDWDVKNQRNIIDGSQVIIFKKILYFFF